MIVNQSNNRITGAGITYDPNGNMSTEVSGQLRGMSYDVLNRVGTVTNWAYATENYFYSARNERIVVRRTGAPDEVNFYGADRLLLGVYKVEQGTFANGTSWVLPMRIDERERVYFGGRLIGVGSGSGGTQVIVSDRLGSVVKKGTQSYRYYPYGQEIGGATANDTAQYATYTRDAWSGLDYAMNRFYKNEWGRFTSPDQGPPDPANPQSWNRYSYAWSDPVNLNDPDGLLPADIGFDGGYGCAYSPFATPGGSVDASSPCPPGMNMQYGSGSGGSQSQLRKIFETFDQLAVIIDDWEYANASETAFNITLSADFFNLMADAGTIRIWADGTIRLGGILVSVDVIAKAGGAIIPFLTNPATITVVGVAAAGIVGWHIYQTSRGNVKDTGIQAEAEELVRRGAAKEICDALDTLLKEAKAAGDSSRQKRIVSTQKVMTAESTDHRIPQQPDKRWFIAETLLLYSIAARRSYLLHNNFILIRTETPETAITLAESRGR